MHDGSLEITLKLHNIILEGSQAQVLQYRIYHQEKQPNSALLLQAMYYLHI